MALSVTIDSSDLGRVAERLALLTEKNIRFAVGQALTETAKAAQRDLKEDLRRTSGGPIEGGATPWTIGGAYVRFATPTNLATEVGLRTDQPRAAGRYISVLTRGGRPRTKGVDLKAGALAGRRLTIVPTPSQRVDARGNVTRNVYGKVLSRASVIVNGRQLNRVAGSRVFITPIKGVDGRMGVFERTGKRGRGRYGSYQGTRMLFTLEPNPKPRQSTYDLTGDLRRSVERYWPGEITRRLQDQLARAGLA
jgi:hypothetical protein